MREWIFELIKKNKKLANYKIAQVLKIPQKTYLPKKSKKESLNTETMRIYFTQYL